MTANMNSYPGKTSWMRSPITGRLKKDQYFSHFIGDPVIKLDTYWWPFSSIRPHLLSFPMSRLSHPLASPEQLENIQLLNPQLEADEIHRIIFSATTFIQNASKLLRLPQRLGATAAILLLRYWCIEPIFHHSPTHLAIAAINLQSKLHLDRPTKNIVQTLQYLRNHTSPGHHFATYEEVTIKSTREHYEEMLKCETALVAALGFDTHVALPHPLAVTYCQALCLFDSSLEGYGEATGKLVARQAIMLLNTALWSPQLLYLSHPPNVLATAAVYLAARQMGVSLPECEWWEVFDVEREELGFVVVGLLSTEAWAKQQAEKRLMQSLAEYDEGDYLEETPKEKQRERKRENCESSSAGDEPIVGFRTQQEIDEARSMTGGNSSSALVGEQPREIERGMVERGDVRSRKRPRRVATSETTDGGDR